MNNPQLDHYVGQPVKEVRSYTGGEDEPVWAIILESGVKILNFNKNYVMPGGLDGLGLTLITLDSNQRAGSRGTVLWFGDRENPKKVTVDLDPIYYAIEDPRYDNERIFPQRSEVQVDWASTPPSEDG